MLISKGLSLASESDERSIYRQIKKEGKKESSALDQYASTRTIFHFLNHKTMFHIQALLHVFV